MAHSEVCVKCNSSTTLIDTWTVTHILIGDEQGESVYLRFKVSNWKQKK